MLHKFSQDTRSAALTELNSQTPFDLLIIGGGITGVGAAREAALRGYRVALVEKRDFANGTSSKSTKLVHGGLRYLEHFEFSLVFEALQERRVLLDMAPHLVRPRSILFPIYKNAKNNFIKVSAGMWLYDTLSLFRNVRNHRMLRGKALKESTPALRSDDLIGAAHFYDAQTHDARLVLANAQQAHEAGATLLTYTEVLRMLRDEEEYLRGVRIRDQLTGTEHEIHARLILNCTGPWTDKIIQMADPTVAPRLRPTKGVHLVLRKERLPLNDALMVSSPEDGRLVFIIPWRNETIVGTTDTDYNDSLDDIPVTAEDVKYLLAVANHAFPNSHLTEHDVQSSWAGLRPLIKDPGAQSEGATSREHDIWESPAGLLNIAGGKLTTYRVMAEQLIDVAAEKLAQRANITPKAGVNTKKRPLPGGEEPLPKFNSTTTVSDEVWQHLVQYYGIYAVRLIEQVAKDETLGERIITKLPYTLVSAKYSTYHK